MIEGQKSLYMQLRDADEDIQNMTPDEWPDKLLDNMKPLVPKKYELSLPGHKYEFDYLENIIEVMNINE